MIHDLGIIDSSFKQRCIEDRFMLLSQRLRDLLPYALQRQVLSSESFFSKFEDIPLAIEIHWLRVISNLHWAKQICNQLGGKIIGLQILFGGKPRIATSGDAIDIFTPRTCHGCEISLALE